MKKIDRADIFIIGSHSNLTKQGIESALKENVYNDKAGWQKLLQLFLITLGVGFTVSGIVFFFAYNWADFHKFAKIGLVEGLVIITTILVLLLKVNNQLKNIILTASAILVGVLFAVFGQIYQTGANAYDFFLVWTIFISLWVFVSNFPPLWIFYLLLINATFILYSQQVAKDWSAITVFTLLFILNSLVVFAAIFITKWKSNLHIPSWFTNIVTLAATISATIGITFGIFSNYPPVFLVLIVLVLVVFSVGIWHGIKTKSGFYLSVIPFSIIVIVSAILIKISDEELMFLLIGLFIILSVTLVIGNLIRLQKKEKNEE